MPDRVRLDGRRRYRRSDRRLRVVIPRAPRASVALVAADFRDSGSHLRRPPE